ncbi:roundabout homolog 2 isoform X2 [Folsomia candida]|nr:roundabout homolog 2 isoform X2 [Folsomia candida]
MWHRNGQNVETRMPSGNGRISNDMGNLVIKDVRATDAGRYQCLAINIAGTRTTPEVLLSVNQKPYFSQQPEDVTVLVSEDASLLCDVRGMPPPEVSWFRQDSNMPSGGRTEPIDGGLKIKEARMEDEGIYFCQANNDLGSIRAAARLTVHSRPKFTTRPRDVRIGLNGVAKFECAAVGSPPPEIRWRKEGSTQYFLPDSEANSRVQLQGPEGVVLRIQGAKREDAGVYVCSALSAAGSRDSIVRLEVTSHDPPPIISHLPTNQTLPIKSMATIPCEVGPSSSSGGSAATIGPLPTVKWLKNGMELEFDASGNNGGRINISPNGTLHIGDLRSVDAGQYTCVASSSSGETSATASLNVESPTNPNIAFHRTNLALLPPPPSQPILVNETQHNSVTLSWTWAMNKVAVPTRTQPLLGFSIETFSPDLQSGWMSIGERIYGGTRMGEVIIHTVDGLKPDTTYVFIIRAENMEGFSVPSAASDSIKTKPRQSSRRGSASGAEELDDEAARNQLSASDIELISAESASSTSIRISWKGIKRTWRGSSEVGYYIRYREIGEGLAFQGFSILTVVAQKNDFDVYSHVIQHLRKSSSYQVFVSPFYRSVEGQASNTKIVSSADDRPSAPPQALLIKMMNTTAASVKWSPPPLEQHNGELKGYRVEVRGNDSRIHAEMDFSPNISTIVLNNLTLGRAYFIRVSAFTSVGLGPFSSPVEVTMDPVLLEGRREHNGVTAEDGGGASQILKEVWFIILMGCLLVVFFILLSIILYTRRQSHGKKDHHISSVVVAPHTDSQFVSGKQSLWIDQRWRPSDASDKDSNRSEAKLLSNHHLMNGEMTEATDYAEVDPQNLTTFYNTTSKGGVMMQMHPQFLHQYQVQQQQQQDLTPYATTTLIQQRRPNYDPLPSNPVSLAKNLMNESRESDQFSSGRSKLSMGSNNFNRFKSAHASPSPSPSAPMKMLPASARGGVGCYPSPGPNRSHEQPLSSQYHHPYHNAHHVTENLYHIGEIFSPNKSASVNNRLSEAVYHQSGDPEDSNFLPQHPLIDREIQSSLPSLASDSTSCNLYAEAEDVIPNSGNNYFSGHSSGGSGGNNSGSSGNCNPAATTCGPRPTKNSRCTSPAYSSDSFNSANGKSGSKKLYNKGNKKKFDNSCKSLERRHLAPLLPGRIDESSYSKPAYPELNGFQKLSRFPRPTISQTQLDNEYPDWQQDCSPATRLPKSLKESNA